VGTVLIVLVAGALLLDGRLEPWCPALLLLVLVLGLATTVELNALLAPGPRPPLWLAALAVAAVLLANWPAHVGWRPAGSAWQDVSGALAAAVLLAFLFEMASFRAAPERGAVARVALVGLFAAYLGLLPSFLVQLRWWPPERAGAGVAALALTIFVPKVGDIGAFFTGRALGRHQMTPLLSPKKTWEGLAGGLAASALLAVLLNRALAPSLLTGDLEAACFGLTVGLAGVLGDLAESMVKRDCGKKDASRAVPGFGGVLDVVDSILFAAPVAYWWLR
jgi:phosphatidate cytidylyltransferase